MGAAVLGTLNQACKSPSGTEPPTPPIRVPVTLQFNIYNHIKGPKGSITKTAMSGDNVIIKVGDLGASDCDPQRIAIREDGFGSLVNFSNTGDTNFIAPTQNKIYDAILFDAYAGVNYGWMDDQNSKLYLSKKNYVVFRKDYDGETGPEEPWQMAIDQLNAALDVGWTRWGSISRQPSATSGDFSYGYGYCFGGMGVNQRYRVMIEQSLGGIGPLTVANEELFENITQVDDIGGTGSGSFKIIDDLYTGHLNEVGRRLFAYVFAKDQAGASSSSKRAKFSFGFM